jgi:hypothetical protein
MAGKATTVLRSLSYYQAGLRQPANIGKGGEVIKVDFALH